MATAATTVRKLLRGFLVSATHTGAKLETTLAALDAAVTPTSSLRTVLETLDEHKNPLYKSLRNIVSELPAKAVTSKILNLFLSKYHFLTRSTKLLSSPYGIIVDPMNACQLACPGCVHSARSKELKTFDWGPGILSESMFGSFMQRYGPYALETEFCNYGEPLLNPKTPQLIHLAKTYLVRTMLSTNIGVKHFDPEAYVNSGLDYMTISIDGATQSVYERFRKKGDLETVFKNVRNLIQTKKRLGKRTPMVSWQFLAFEHNQHEIGDAIKLAQEFGVDQLMVGAPFDVSADDPNVLPSQQVARTVVFNHDAGEGMKENWNPFPSDLQAAVIEREFAASWSQRLPKNSTDETPNGEAASRHTCQYLYKNIVMDGRGRIVPCCAAPQHGMELVFGNAESGTDVFNSDKYQLARQSFANPERYRSELTSAGLFQGPFCEKCTWNQDTAQIDKEHIVNYFDAVGQGVFNPASLALLGSW